MNSFGLTTGAFSPLQMAVLCGLSLIAAISDIALRRIPNWLTFPMLATGLAWSSWQRGPLGFLDALAASVILALPYIVLFVYANGGGGDVKLMAAIGAWAGLVPGLFVLIGVALSGVVMGFVFALARGQFRTTLGRLAGVVNRAMPAVAGRNPVLLSNALTMDRKEMQPMPYGVAIFVGVCVVMGGMALWHG